MKSKRAREIAQWGLVAILISVLLYFGDVSGLSRLSAVHWPSILFVFLTTGGSILIHNLRWTSIVREMVSPSTDSKINFFQFHRWLLNSYALGTLIPSDISLAGVRTLYMNRTQILSLPAGLFSVLFDRFFDLIVLFALVLPSALFVMKVANAIQALSLLGLILAAIFFYILWKKGEG
ncbi:MAG TPA: lysylphosphatidylglycerol synthase domain-containing protein, partial [Thermodesulfobacteriota bacterium]|nr:lysylphosphatidylglycerol synthase domain-containing protein [Thermodesulfobacteriota bacterium]